jgi:hypothetical protein
MIERHGVGEKETGMSLGQVGLLGCSLHRRLFVVVFLCFASIHGSAQLAGGQVVEVISEAANVREGPSTDSVVLLRATRGTKFNVVARIGAWYEVEIPAAVETRSTTGYLHRVTVEEVDEVPTIGPGDIARERDEPAPDPLPPAVGTGAGSDPMELQRHWTESQWAEYERFKKSEFAAAGLEWVIPMLGYAYVDKATDGLTPALVSLGGLTVAFVGVYAGDTGSPPLFWSGFIGYVGGRIWGIVNALEYADSYNADLTQRISSAPITAEGYQLVFDRKISGDWVIGMRIVH